MDGIGSGACVGFLVGGTDACTLWWVELSLFPVMNRAASGGVFGVSLGFI